MGETAIRRKLRKQLEYARNFKLKIYPMFTWHVLIHVFNSLNSSKQFTPTLSTNFAKLITLSL